MLAASGDDFRQAGRVALQHRLVDVAQRLDPGLLLGDEPAPSSHSERRVLYAEASSRRGEPVSQTTIESPAGIGAAVNVLVRQSIRRAWPASPAALANWSMIPQLTPT